jgi:TusA-related sulfurtransferase
MVKTLDVRGEICPDPLTLTIKEVAKMALGEELKVIVDSPTALETITRWAQNVGHNFLGVREIGPAQWEIHIRK